MDAETELSLMNRTSLVFIVLIPVLYAFVIAYRQFDIESSKKYENLLRSIEPNQARIASGF